MSCGGAWSYNWTNCNGQMKLQTTGNVPQDVLQQLQQQYGAQIMDNNSTESNSAEESPNSETEAEGSTASNGGSGDWRQAALDRHNYHRRRHGAPDMVLDPAVNAMAQRTADYLASRRMMAHVSKQQFGHSYGENLATSLISDPEKAGVDATDRWYNEVSMYNYGYPGFSMQTGHFTQVVWKASTKLGIGYAKNGNFMIVVGQYSPHGNMQGDFPRNVGQRQ